MGTSDQDKIEKKVVIHAPVSRVWMALTDAEEFGKWFGAKLEQKFVAGARVTGNITYPGYEHLRLEVMVERIEPEHLFSFRWHPHAMETDTDYSGEPSTLVEFRIEEVSEGTLLTMVESGFDEIPADRRDEAFHRYGDGWTEQMTNIQRHVEG